MKVSREVAERRPSDIIAACRKLYRKMSFKEITLKEISKEANISRPSIYNYFQTKEEIFLAILQEEYRLWGHDLEKLLESGKTMGLEDFAEAITSSLADRTDMLKILCMNLYEIEDNSRKERLVDFKKEYKNTWNILHSCIEKFFPSLEKTEQDNFIYELLSFLYGIYPYAHPTEKQLAAMNEAGLQRPDITITGLTRAFITDSLEKTRIK